jgi:hypothetical protein
MNDPMRQSMSQDRRDEERSEKMCGGRENMIQNIDICPKGQQQGYHFRIVIIRGKVESSVATLFNRD